MAILTGRLEALAQQIKPGETMADIGTDHGFLPISLFTAGTCPKVIMTDVSNKALAHARHHAIGVFGLSEDNFRSGDGLSPINPGEVDVVVLAGMGGILMTAIMNADLSKSKSISKFIFQPRNHPEVLRYWLRQNGFTILNESLVRERKNLCEIIVAASTKAVQASMQEPKQSEIFSQIWPPSWPKEDIRWEIPPWFGEIRDPLAIEYLHKKRNRELRVHNEVQKRQTLHPESLEELDRRIEYLTILYEKRDSNDEL
jgi:tRNA (adenine22-N1)-methyltransferase